jgi:hypothetical protein
LTGRTANNSRTFFNIPRHYATRTDHRTIADGDSGKNDSATADPDIPPDVNRPSKFQPFTAFRRIAWMVRAVNLDRWADLRSLSD